ncbi:hypothetical protein MAMMFC1_03212 [Methylomusa anaerophila]|uniref:Uncharacterized protein n=1 Tax=Methylomusa anaerophila TaxID=1930071 RepID=A0A348AN71_9FIRM|nr:hypothetical protein MAMMFC1_03212 [Methylomusa anaerophila]
MANCSMNECGKSIIYTLSVVGGKWKWIIDGNRGRYQSKIRRSEETTDTGQFAGIVLAPADTDQERDGIYG